MRDQLLDLQTTDSFRLYLDEVGRHPLLTKQDEVELSQAYDAGLQARLKLADCPPDDPARPELEQVAARGEQARRTMIESNLRLVVSIAKNYRNQGLPFLDLIQEGTLGLVRAAEKFDYRKGFKFSTYATWWIRQAVTRAIADKGRTIRVPVHMVEKINKYYRVQRGLGAQLNRDPTDEEVASIMEVDAEEIVRIRRVSRRSISLETPVGEDHSSELGDFIADEESESPHDLAKSSLLKARMREALGSLPERERMVLEYRFGLTGGQPKTLEEVGERFDVTRERIRQIQLTALAKIKSSPHAAGLRDLLE
jgi:RNA polymerase primary sigma factor